MSISASSVTVLVKHWCQPEKWCQVWQQTVSQKHNEINLTERIIDDDWSSTSSKCRIEEFIPGSIIMIWFILSRRIRIINGVTGSAMNTKIGK